MDLERSEACAKTYVLIRGELLIPENQHGVAVVRLLDQRKGDAALEGADRVAQQPPEEAAV